MRHRCVMPVAAAGLLGLATPVSAQCMYEVTIVAGPPCGDDHRNITFYGINDLGDACGYVCGSCITCFTLDPIAWSGRTGLVFLEAAPGDETPRANDLNVHGDIVGTMEYPDTPDVGRMATLWRDGAAIPLVLPEGATLSEGNAINNAGVVAGAVDFEEGPWQATLWVDGQIVNIGPDIPTLKSFAFDINEHNVVVGRTSENSTLSFRGFVWHAGRAIILPPVTDVGNSEAFAVNDRGHVAGHGNIRDLFSRRVGFVWRDGEMTILDDLPSQDDIEVKDINDAGQIVGQAEGANAAFLWQDGEIIDLNDRITPVPGLDIHLRHAWAINDRGQIAGYGTVFPPGAPGYQAGYILTPIDSGPADLNIDCRVDAADLMIMLQDWGDSQHLPSDIDGDGIVGPRDLAALLADWRP
ncbi:MAG: DUF3466 family protein [Phycisphaerales bacterium]|nr:DUF3466 family protein [Phycisphaerales bacterium]